MHSSKKYACYHLLSGVLPTLNTLNNAFSFGSVSNERQTSQSVVAADHRCLLQTTANECYHIYEYASFIKIARRQFYAGDCLGVELKARQFCCAKMGKLIMHLRGKLCNHRFLRIFNQTSGNW